MPLGETLLGLALINTNFEGITFYPADSMLAIATIGYHLEVKGFTNISLFPDSRTETTLFNIEDEFKKFIITNDCEIYAFSCWSGSFSFTKSLIAIIKQYRPNALVIGGGVHFFSKESVDQNLSDKTFDIIFSGGADSFIDFCESFFLKHSLKVKKTDNGIDIKGLMNKKGISYLFEGATLRNGIGTMTRPILPVIFASEDGFEMQIFFNDRCSNACDYCCIYKIDTPENVRRKTEDLVFIQLKFIRETYRGTINISIMDSSPMQKSNRAKTLGSMRRIKNFDNNISWTIFADPEDFDDEFAHIIEELDIRSVFLGRDRVTKDELIGRRLHGKLRDSDMLDAEFESLKTFLGNFTKTKTKREFYIGYIISPEENEKSAIKMLEEIRYYADISDDYLVVQPNIFILNPYKATKVYDRVKNISIDIEDFCFPYPNVWLVGGKVFDYLEYVRLIVSPIFSTGKFHKLGYNILSFVASICFGLKNIKQITLNEKEFKIFNFIKDKIETNDTSEDTETLFALGVIPPASATLEDVSKVNLENLIKSIIKNSPMIPLLKKDSSLKNKKSPKL